MKKRTGNLLERNMLNMVNFLFDLNKDRLMLSRDTSEFAMVGTKKLIKGASGLLEIGDFSHVLEIAENE